jgi:hypothetical protein
MAEGYLEPVWCQVGECKKEMHASILKPRHDLEQQSIEGLTAALVESDYDFVMDAFLCPIPFNDSLILRIIQLRQC